MLDLFAILILFVAALYAWWLPYFALINCLVGYWALHRFCVARPQTRQWINDAPHWTLRVLLFELWFVLIPVWYFGGAD